MTDPHEQPEPNVPGSGGRAPSWLRHPITGIIAALIAWFGLTWKMLDSTRDDIAEVEGRLNGDIVAVETRLKEDITAAEARLNSNIAGVEDRLGDHMARVEGRLDRIMEILLDEARRANTEDSDADRP